TATLTITGTNFTGVSCPSGVRLDDLNGAGAAVNTQVTSCTVDSGTQITATFPAGIRTNGNTGWNVIVTNSNGSNSTSSFKFVPRAGLLISEVMYEGSAANIEFVELYNPTNNAIDVNALNLKLRRRTAAGGDSAPVAFTINNNIIPAKGFFLMASSTSSAQTWYSSVDATFTAAFAPDNIVYISTTANLTGIIDRIGYGTITDTTLGCEGGNANCATLGINNSIQRAPAGGAGNATDTDNNASDILTQSAGITPKGTASATEP
ncbi:MAG: lamin tail domain-containing protein, partial [Leptospiraceae bacterium]|nr:lamin tail domain-containing protein [Leptospiraceae bacterium]